jgi:hypothetical protein
MRGTVHAEQCVRVYVCLTQPSCFLLHGSLFFPCFSAADEQP